ncbi:hypothetical protein FHS38_001287 [Streptomyces netropsis]|uniref:Uncharacterized protein n=1 Tax=Streptomyces netropsis TaxID=55404 RepID=A0A7W7PCS0_STRNE|nr:DUF6528 family protein [Streptomyces netropsis]MBB4885259.1 hypothetical protein [Streptomyces netropsis]
MRRVWVAVLAALSVLGTSGVAQAHHEVGGRSTLAAVTPIVTADQATRSVYVLDAERTRWSAEGPGGGVLWSWRADGRADLADLRPGSSWTNPSEVKLREMDGRRYLLTTASGGLAAVVRYPEGTAYWAADTGSGNAHSIELLPDGNVAVAASKGEYVRLYAASRSTRATEYTQVALAGAHGVHWDPRNELLWALGDRELVALAVGGTADYPALTVVHRRALPTRGGHDLAPVLASPGRLWVTTSSAVYQYATSERQFVSYPLQSRVSGRSVKSVGDDPVTGQVLVARPEAGNPCVWCTSTLTLYQPDGTRTLLRGGMYKARWWSPYRS